MDGMQMRNHHPKFLTLLVYRQRVYSIRVLSSRGCFLFLVIFLSEVTIECIIAIFSYLCTLFGLAYTKAKKDIVFRFIIEL